MTRDDWLELTVLERKKYNYLTEVQDVTRQLAESLDRNDQVSTRMLIAMRQDPIRQLAEVDNSEKLRLGTFSEQAGKTRRLLEQVVELDRRTSLRMAGEQSYYNK